MSQNLTRINVALTMTTGAFSRSTKAAISTAKAFGDGLERAILRPVGLITAGLSGGAMIAGIKAAGARIDELAKSAERLGVSTQSLAGLRLAADDNRVAHEQLEQAMTKLQLRVELAAQGNAVAAKSFTDLGLSVDELRRLSADQQMAKFADGIATLGSHSAKTAAAVGVLGESGSKLNGILALGSDGMAKAAQDAKDLGLAVSTVDAAKVEEAEGAWRRIGQTIEGIFNRIAVALAPFVTALANAFTDASKEAKGFGDSIKTAVDGAIAVVGFFADAWQGVTLAFQAVRVVVADITHGVIEFADNAIQSVQAVGETFSRTWDFIKATADVLWSSLTVGWAALKVPVADFVQFTASQLAKLIMLASDAAYQFSAAQGAALQSAAMQMQAATGAMGVEARKTLDQNVIGIKAAAADMAAATGAMVAPIYTQSSELMRNLRADAAALSQEQMAELERQRNQPLASSRIAQAAAEIQTEAQMRAEARAKELEANRVSADAGHAVEADSWIRFYDWSQGAAEEDADFRSRIYQASLGNASSFFGNLSKLQESNSKRAQAIGKVAAKAKIVTDTATAAMGAYASLAAIPLVGPALGAAAAAAAIAAGAVQMSNVDSGTMGSSASSGPADVSTTNVGGISAPRNTQTLVLQGDSFSAEALTRMFDEAKERGIVIEGVRRA